VNRELLACLVSFAFAMAGTAFAEEVLPRPEPPFAGKIGITTQESVKDFPKEVEAPKGAPNILVILTDDVGFGASSTFGGPIPTPTMDRLAQQGLRYTQFHTTALCSPTRAALLSGRNHHSAATGVIMEAGTGFPGYNTLMPRSAGTFAEVLRLNGYNTAWYGKNHNVPDWHGSQAGPFGLWPTGLGFEYFYGFIGGDTSQWNPALVENIKPIEPPHDAKDYFFDDPHAAHITAPFVHFDISTEEVLVTEFVSGVFMWELMSAIDRGSYCPPSEHTRTRWRCPTAVWTPVGRIARLVTSPE